MPLDFPNTPAINDTWVAGNGVTYVWTGTMWAVQAGSGSGVVSFNTRSGVVSLLGADITGAGGALLAAPVFTGDARAVTATTGDNDTSIATTQFVQTAAAPALSNIGRNVLHNPLFNVAQRGAGPWTVNGYTLDRWLLGLSLDSASVSQSAQADANRAQIGDEAPKFLLGNTFTGNAGAAAYNRILQRIEDVRRLAGKTVIVSLWAWAGAGTPKLGVGIVQNFGTGGSPSAAVVVAGQSVTLSTTAARYSLTFVIPSATGKTLGSNGDDNTELSLWFSSGTTNATAAGSPGVQSGTVALWGIQLEVGTTATPLEKPDPRYDLANCQRFYQIVACSVRAAMTGVGSLASPATWPQMRATPTVTLNVAGARGNTTSQSLTAGTPYGGFFGCASAAAGDAYVLNDLYNLSADL